MKCAGILLKSADSISNISRRSEHLVKQWFVSS